MIAAFHASADPFKIMAVVLRPGGHPGRDVHLPVGGRGHPYRRFRTFSVPGVSVVENPPPGG